MYSRGCHEVKRKWLSPVLILCAGLLCPWNTLGKDTGEGSRSLLQGIFLTQGLNPGLPHCRQILFQLSHRGSPEGVKEIAMLVSDLPQ